MTRPFPDPDFTTLQGVWAYAVTVSDGWFSILFMLSAAGVAFSILKWQDYRMSDSFMVSFAISTFLGSFLWVAQVMDVKILMIFFAFTVLSALWSALDR